MRPPDPVFSEAMRGLTGSGAAHLEYLLYLFLQAVVLFIWWPKDSLLEALAAADRPDTLLASAISTRVRASSSAVNGTSTLVFDCTK